MVKPSKKAEVQYRKALENLVKSLETNTKLLIEPVLRQYEAEYVGDAYASVLEQAMDRLRAMYNGLDQEAKFVSSTYTTGVNAEHKRRFYTSMQRAVGVDLKAAIMSENLGDTLQIKTRENVSLIKSIPEEYFKKLENIVYQGTTQKNSAKSLIEQITKLGHSTESRAKLIARDQTAKLNSVLNQERQQNLGVEEYIWVTADDGDVREEHARNNGKTFRWDTPPKNTGHPGEEIQCRCIAQPRIKI